ncbi:hypothetical protein [Methylobacterium sp. SI9]|uniref:hypothetical protein n=1 Tax=Methylobacterium guangdongense TaxID=3138811 RepID=UPI00313AE086
MTRIFLRLPLVALGLAAALATPPALGQQGGRAPGRAGPDRSAPDKGLDKVLDKGADKAADRRGGPPVIGCPSLANYRMLMHGGPQAAAALLADPKADHLGCSVLTRGDITGLADRVSLGGQSYDCASLRTTTACHWVEAGAVDRPGSAGR